MAKVKYDVSGVEGGQDFDQPIPPGVYVARVDECTKTTSKAGNDQLALTLKIAEGQHKNRNVWDYVPFTEAAAWKLRSFIDALGMKEKGSIDTNEVEGSLLRIRIKHESSAEYGTRAKVGAMLPMPEDEPEEAEEEDEEDEDEADEGLGEDLTWEDIEDMDLDELKEVIEDEELSVRVTKKSKVETVRTKVAEELGLEEPEDEDDDEEDDADEDDDDELDEDYDDWAVSDLKSELKERGLSTGGKKSALIKRLEKDDEDGDDEPF